MEETDGMRSPWRGVGRFFVWCGVGVVGLGVLWGIWYGVAGRRLDGVLAGIKARGEPTTVWGAR
jgi:hypothetical protein